MKNVFISLIVITLSALAFSNQDAKNVAQVKIKKGKASVIFINGDTAEITKDMWIKEGAMIKTQGASFVRLKFIDKSSMNIGPKSEIKIEKFDKKEAGVINVLTGKIRSQVSKNYLEMEKGKSKLFVKSKSAVMGIRGTDFLFSTNAKTGATTAVLFEGSVVFSKLQKGENQANLEKIVNRGRRINPGQFSVAMNNINKATVPSKLSSSQFGKLMKNENFEVAKNEIVKKVKSIVPPGLKGEAVTSDVVIVKVDTQNIAPGKVAPAIPTDSKGFVNGDDVKPVDGSIVHIDSGIIVPLGKDSVYDKNAGEWVSSSVGGIDSKGDYIPPKDFKVTDDGKLVKIDDAGRVLKEVVVDVSPLDKTKPLDESKMIEPSQPSTQERIPGSDSVESKGETEAKVLAVPPRPVGETFAPAGYTNSPPKEVIRIRKTGRANVNVRVNN